jgi:hypothetical protein
MSLKGTKRSHMKFYYLSAMLGLILVSSGCTTSRPFNDIPTESYSFNLSKDQLQNQYPEIQKYEKRFRGFSPNTPLIQELISKWGEPDKKRKKMSYPLLMGGTLGGCSALFGPIPALAAGGAAIAIRPYVPEYYYWHKENYCIEAILDKTIDHGYKKRMISWQWYDLRTKNEIPEECKN